MPLLAPPVAAAGPVPAADFAPPRPRLPAWALSAAAHVLGALLLAWLLPAAAPHAGGGEEDGRAVAIALASPGEDAPAEYFTPADEAAPADPASVADLAAGPASAAADAAFPADELPPALAATEQALPVEDRVGFGPPGSVLTAAAGSPRLQRAAAPGAGDEAILAEEAARRAALAAAGPRGPLVQVQLFGALQIEGRSFVFLLDRSQSMGGEGLNALAAAERELAAAVNGLDEKNEFQILAYHFQPVYLGPRKLLLATPENKRSVPGYFAGLAPFGATEHESALLAALRLTPDAIVLLTDGGEPPLSAGQIERIGRRAGARTRIHCLEFGLRTSASEESFLRSLAERCGGTYAYLNLAGGR